MGLTADESLTLANGTRLKFCKIRERWLFLVPERVLYPCPQTVEVLQQLSEPTKLSDVASQMAKEYDAPVDVIEADIVPIIASLVEDGYVRRAA